MSRHFAHAVVGKGLIGSAAARHLAEAGHQVVLIGPDEPAESATHGGVFASHYDAGRITRSLDRDPLWAQLAAASLDRHQELEAASGIRFHNPHPLLCVAGPDSDLVTRMEETARTLDLPLGPGQLHPELHLPPRSSQCGQGPPAGWIDPRALVRAQTVAAVAAGAKVIRQPVWALRENGAGVGLILDDASEVLADRVLLCAGAFTAPVGLASGVPLAAEGRSVLLARVPETLLDRLADLPCLIMHDPASDPADLSLMPPIRYPDGHHYVKLGSATWRNPLPDLESLQQWFRLPPPGDDVARLTGALHRLLPVLGDAELRVDSCAVTVTPGGRPLVDWTHPGRVAVAGGGNGKAAKSSDELGRLAALLLTGTELPDEMQALHL